MKVYQHPRNHEKRWSQLIEPLIPKNGADRLFLDLGCNAGFYMQKMQQLGYGAIGVEKDPGYIEQAPTGLNIIQKDINHYDIPATYITFMACVHYHQSEAQIEALIHRALYRSAYMIFMGRHKGRTLTRPQKPDLMKKLKHWDVTGETETSKFYAVCVKNRYVREMEVEELCEVTQKQRLEWGHPEFPEAFGKFCRSIINGESIDYARSEYVAHLHSRKRLYPLGRCWIYENMVLDIQKNGIQEPIQLKRGYVANGHHRLIIAKELGIKRVICIAQRVPR